MIRRPLTAAVATLSTLLVLTACNGSPEAGRPNTTPTSQTPSPTPTPTGPPTPTLSPQEQAAVTDAKARYVAARAAVGVALKQPTKATRAALAAAGNGGTWVIAVAGQVNFQVENGWYQTGDPKIVSLAVQSVRLKLEQPEVRLTSCIDSAQVVTRYQSNGKPVPAQGDDGNRHRFQSRLVYAKSVETGRKMWFLVEEKVAGTC
jgi:hypothetical protein